jgi:hypothetical protein
MKSTSTLSRADALAAADRYEQAARELRSTVALYDMNGGRKAVSAVFELPAEKQSFTTSTAASVTTRKPALAAPIAHTPTRRRREVSATARQAICPVA